MNRGAINMTEKELRRIEVLSRAGIEERIQAQRSSKHDEAFLSTSEENLQALSRKRGTGNCAQAEGPNF